METSYGEDDRDRAISDLFQESAGAMGGGRARPVASMSAGLFKRIVADLCRGPAVPCRITGEVRWSDARFGNELVFRNIRFDEDFIAEVAEFTTLRFVDCVFQGRATLRNCRVRGDLFFEGCKFAGRAKKAKRMVLDGTRIDGHLAVTTMRLAGGLSANSARCLGLQFGNVVITGDCDLVDLEARRHVMLNKTRIGGRLAPRFLKCGGLMRLENECRVDGETDLAGAQIASQLDFADGNFGEIRFNGSTIGSLWIGSSGAVACRAIYAIDSRFTSYVRMSRLTVSVPSAGRSTKGGKLRVGAEPPKAPPWSDEWGKIYFRHCRFGSQVWAWAWQRDDRIGGWQDNNYVAADRSVSFIDCDVGGELNLTRLRIGAAGKAGTLRLDRTNLRGWLFISSPTAVTRRLEMPAEARRNAQARVEEGRTMAEEFRARMRSLSLRDFSASGVELSGLDLVRCGRDDADGEVDGSLVGDRARIAGTFATYACPDSIDEEVRREHRAHATIAGAMRLAGASIGELRLAGDSFDERHKDRASKRGVVLERAEIGLLRVPRVKGVSKRPSEFPVPLDLSGMTVRNWNFDEDADVQSHAEVEEYLDFLDNDEFLHREVYKSVAQSLRNAGRDREAEKILYAEEYRARWETRQARAAARRAARNKEGRRDHWPALDRRNRPKGRWGGGWFTPVRHRLGRLGTMFEWVDRQLLGYRRNPIGLLYAILGLFALSALFVSSHAANFELSEASRLVLQHEAARVAALPPGAGAGREGPNFAAGLDPVIDGRNVGPDPRHWTVWNAVWMATRYHVPIVSMAIEDEYVASNDNRLRFACPLCPRVPRPPGADPGEIFFAAEDWFAVMSILNWIMWPLLLTFALRRALRSD